MIRGTTATFKFELPYAFSELSNVRVAFWQDGNNGTTERPVPIVKDITSCSCGSSATELVVKLNQEETARFLDTSKAMTQLHADLSDGSGFASLPQEITVYPLHQACSSDVTPSPTPSGDTILDGGVIGG